MLRLTSSSHQHRGRELDKFARDRRLPQLLIPGSYRLHLGPAITTTDPDEGPNGHEYEATTMPAEYHHPNPPYVSMQNRQRLN